MYPYDMGLVALDLETLQAIQSQYDWSPQIPLSDRASADGPSLAAAGTWVLGGGPSSDVYMAWRGIPEDDDIYWSIHNGDSWSPQENIPGGGFASAHGPALATGFTATRSDGVPVTGLFMAWDGVPGDDAIYFAQNPLLQGWTEQQRVEGVGTSDRPGLAMFGGRMYMAWKGIPGDSTIFWSTFDGNGWTPQQSIAGRGTSFGPALAALGNRLYMFWKGIEDDSSVFFAWIDDQPNAIWQPQQPIAYTESQVGGQVNINIGTSHRPAAAVHGNAIALAWKGVPGDTNLWFAFLENDQWSGQVNVPDIGSASGPALAAVPGRMYMAWQGIPGDTGLYYSSILAP